MITVFCPVCGRPERFEVLVVRVQKFSQSLVVHTGDIHVEHRCGAEEGSR